MAASPSRNAPNEADRAGDYNQSWQSMRRAVLFLRGEERLRDALVFSLKRARCRGLSGLPVPIAGVLEIALNAMQIGVHPGAVLAAFVHDDLVCLIPVVLAGPPERRERNAQALGRARLRLTLLEFGKRHDTVLSLPRRGRVGPKGRGGGAAN